MELYTRAFGARCRYAASASWRNPEVPLEQKERKFALPGAEGKPLGFATETSRVELYSEQLRRSGYPAVPTYAADELSQSRCRFPYVLTSAKNGYYCHSQHRNLASLRKRAPLSGGGIEFPVSR